MNKTTAIHEIVEVLKPRVVPRVPKQRQSRVFLEISREVFDISSEYVLDLNANTLEEAIKEEKKVLYQKAFLYGREHWTLETIKQVESIIKRQPWWRRLWWAIDPKKMDIRGVI